jgi:hypothetical protein
MLTLEPFMLTWGYMEAHPGLVQVYNGAVEVCHGALEAHLEPWGLTLGP